MQFAPLVVSGMFLCQNVVQNKNSFCFRNKLFHITYKYEFFTFSAGVRCVLTAMKQAWNYCWILPRYMQTGFTFILGLAYRLFCDGKQTREKAGFWYVTSRSLLEIYQRVCGTYCLRLQGRRITGVGACLANAMNQHTTRCIHQKTVKDILNVVRT